MDILINNAGITVDKTVRKMAPEEWDHVTTSTCPAGSYVSRAVLQHMLDRGYGRIIMISSVIGSAWRVRQASLRGGQLGRSA